MDRAELENLSSPELHDRAMEVARDRLDLSFLWSLVKAIPPAEAAAGRVDEAETDVMSMTALITDLIHAGEGEVADALRPLYIDYLAQHS